jgi:PEP-CTERM motif
VIIQPSSVSLSPAGDGFFGPANNIINQSGLSSTYTSGVTDFDTYTATATHSFGSTFNTKYGQSTTNIVNTPVLFTFDLGQVSTIDALAYWISDTSTGPGFPDQDVQGFQLFAGTDDTGTLLGTYNATQGNFNNVSNAQIFNFTATSTQFITLKATSVFLPGGDGIANPIIGEIAFRQQEVPPSTPEPGTILGLVTVGSLGALSRKRKG